MDLKVKKLVHQALINNPATRGDDFILINEVLKNYVAGNTPIDTVLRKHNELQLPSFASIIRFRRYIQNEDSELLPQDNILESRAAEEQAYRNYARNN